MKFLFVFLGAGLGGAARYSVSVLLARSAVVTIFPLSTFIVNILGSLLMGMVIGYFSARGGLAENWKLFLTTGIMGGFTTFSAFSLETVLLIENGNFSIAALYVLLSVILGVAALTAGLYLMRLI